MRLFLTLIIFIFISNCSFDNKTGIWIEENKRSISKKENDLFKEFETLNSVSDSLEQEFPIDKNYNFRLTKPIINTRWQDNFYNKENNLKNFKYKNFNQLIFKSKKVSNYQTSNLLLDSNNVITSDERGNIYVYSLNDKKIILKYNFYKKKYKKISKKLYLIINNNIIYVSDNLGYLYALDYSSRKILWAKNYKVPFRSNLKIFKNKLIAANQKNNIFFFNKNNGIILNKIVTERTTIKNKFINNLSLNEKDTFFLNTYGSLYSIDNQNMKVNWFINLNQSLELNPSNLFKGNTMINNGNLLMVNSENHTYIIEANTGRIVVRHNFSSDINSLMLNNYLFLKTKKNFLTAVDLGQSKIIYSLDINKKVEKFLKSKKNNIKVVNMAMVNNEIFLFLHNSNILKFNIRGNLNEIDKLPSKLNAQPLFIDGSILYIDKKNKINILN